ncbi:MAG TPA: hypothetical protein DEA50_16230 [Parvularcula sp.]|nr:hypothetical protein [Parvularcula sp.]
MGWAAKLIDRATWTRFAFWFAAFWAVSWFFFYRESAWTRALKAGGGKLPESQPGFPPLEPQRSLEALEVASATQDYILWQALDLPFAFVVVMMTATAIALGLKGAGLRSLSFPLAVPPLYFAMELVENAFVAAFAAKIAAPAEAVVLVQQTATTIKMGAGWGAIWLALLGLAAASVSAIIRIFRKRA